MKEKIIRSALGINQADLVLKNAKIVNVFTGQILDENVAITNGIIAGCGDYEGRKEIDLKGKYVLPGLIDSHIHIESTMAIPSVLSPVLLSKGVTTIIADPHEIVNAAGKNGLDFMLEDAARSDIDIYFMVPSSVPSCDFEINGAGVFSAKQMEAYRNNPKILGLGEVMRFNDVLNQDGEMMKRFDLFSQKVIDGHAPGLSGKQLNAYRAAGIETDHEAITVKEAIERLQNGFALLMREGSGARNVKTLLSGLLKEKISLYNCCFCTDDKHLEDIIEEGTIILCLKEAVECGCDPVEAIRMATLNAARTFGLKTKGAIAPGYDADLVVVDDLKDFKIDCVFCHGRLFVSEQDSQSSFKEGTKGKSALNKIPEALRHSVKIPEITSEELLSLLPEGEQVVIEMVPKQLQTIKRMEDAQGPSQKYNLLLAAERYGKKGSYAAALLKGFNLKNGAIASTIAHDSHNVIAAGDNVRDLLIAIKRLEEIEGGLVLAENGEVFEELSMPAGGLMSAENPQFLDQKIRKMKAKARKMGIPEGIDPFANLSFLSLPVIGEVRLTTEGIYDFGLQKFIRNDGSVVEESE